MQRRIRAQQRQPKTAKDSQRQPRQLQYHCRKIRRRTGFGATNILGRESPTGSVNQTVLGFVFTRHNVQRVLRPLPHARRWRAWPNFRLHTCRSRGENCWQRRVRCGTMRLPQRIFAGKQLGSRRSTGADQCYLPAALQVRRVLSEA